LKLEFTEAAALSLNLYGGGVGGGPSSSLWVTAQEIAALPSSGAAFDRLEAAALGAWGSPDLGGLESQHDVLTLGGALYAQATGDATARAKVVTALEDVVASVAPLVTVLELARGLQSYVIAASIINYQDSAFRTQVATWVDQNLSGHSTANSLRETALRSANNWGGHSRATLAAAGLYLQNNGMVADAVKGHQEFIGTYAGGSPEMVWTTTDWHFDALDKAGVNRLDSGVFSGTIPEDWRRDLTFDPTTVTVLADLEPVVATYLWEAMQGFAVTAVLLHNSGHVDLSEGDNALQRAADVLIATAHPALGDDRWLPYLFNQYLTGPYNTFGDVQDGKGMGWTDFTGVASPFVPENLVSSNQAATSIQLDWDALGGAVSYNVYKSTTSASTGFTLLSNPTAATYTDTAFSETQDTWYKVVGVDGSDNESGDSNVVSYDYTAPGAEPYDLSPYSASLAELGLTAVWPIAPTGTLTPVTVTPATLAANNVNGRSLTLSAGDYGNVTISNTDQEWILQPGALINTLTIGASSQRIVVKGETPRVGRIGNFASVGGNTDLLVDGVYQIQGLYSGTYEVQNGFGGTRVAVVNSSLNSHGYAVRAYPDTDGRLYNFILAGNYIRQDGNIPVQNPIGVQLMRVKCLNEYIIAGNYMTTPTGSMGFRLHSDEYSSANGYVGNNIIHTTASPVFQVMFVAPAGQTGTAQSMDNLMIEDNYVYSANGGGPIRPESTPPQATEATNVVLRNNVGYTGVGWITSQPSWTISGNTSNSYQAPPTSISKVGF